MEFFDVERDIWRQYMYKVITVLEATMSRRVPMHCGFYPAESRIKLESHALSR